MITVTVSRTPILTPGAADTAGTAHSALMSLAAKLGLKIFIIILAPQSFPPYLVSDDWRWCEGGRELARTGERLEPVLILAR